MSKAYQEAGRVLSAVHTHKISLKNALLDGSSKEGSVRKVYALVLETLRWKEVLLQVVSSVRPVSSCPLYTSPDTHWVFMVALYDALLGKGRVEGGGRMKKIIRGSKAALSASLSRLKIAAGAGSNQDLLPPHIRNMPMVPRYARINTLKRGVDMESAIGHYQGMGYSLVPLDDALCVWEASEGKGKNGERKGRNLMAVDPLLENEILVFPPSTDFHSDEWYLAGKIILQDKASCFPAALLAPPPGAVVVDACAAPGNKTSHLVATMGGKGTVFAFDKSPPRLALLKRLTGRAGADVIITPVLGDFLQVDVSDPQYADVTHLLVDPSCSGSGIVSRLDVLLGPSSSKASSSGTAGTVEEEAGDVDMLAATGGEPDRLAALAEFQVQVMLHALSFPSATRVTYSTCSVHVEENEAVVHAILDAARAQGWRLAVPDGRMAAWTRRGLGSAPLKCPNRSPEENVVVKKVGKVGKVGKGGKRKREKEVVVKGGGGGGGKPLYAVNDPDAMAAMLGLKPTKPAKSGTSSIFSMSSLSSSKKKKKTSVFGAVVSDDDEAAHDVDEEEGGEDEVEKGGEVVEDVFTDCETCKAIAKRVIRTHPNEDHTIGFFVALFERDPAAAGAAEARPEDEDEGKDVCVFVCDCAEL